MPTRSWISTKQRRAAQLLLDGISGYRALIEAGYSRWSARKPAELIRRSWGLRQALLEEQKARDLHLHPAPKRKKYIRRPTGLTLENYVFPENSSSFSNVPVHRLHENTQRVERISQGLPPKEIPQAPGFMEHMTRCPECGRSVSRNQLFLSQTGNYVCPRCAGV